MPCIFVNFTALPSWRAGSESLSLRHVVVTSWQGQPIRPALPLLVAVYYARLAVVSSQPCRWTRLAEAGHHQDVLVLAVAPECFSLAALVLEPAAFVQPDRPDIVRIDLELNTDQPEEVVG